MRLSTAALLFLLAGCFFPGHGILEANYTNLKCRCSGMISSFIHPSNIERIQITSRGNGCPNDEVLIWTRSKKVVCVNPRARWLQKVLRRLQGKSLSSPAPAPVSRKRTVST